MTNEEKELLIKDLCERVPYGVKCHVAGEGDATLNGVITKDGEIYGQFTKYDGEIQLEAKLTYAIPYLRPMESITDEEFEELHRIVCPNNVGSSFEGDGFYFLECDADCHYISYTFMSNVIDFMLKKHLDYRGLIPNKLALEIYS